MLYVNHESNIKRKTRGILFYEPLVGYLSEVWKYKSKKINKALQINYRNVNITF